ncbi:MAG: hypothetical protein JOZ53_21610 [Planctomycetaceae bacterium]|nr:hypothetical protein [Planctomycetaceae bacterium]
MSKMFNFDPARYTSAYAEQGYIHIPKGLTEEFYGLLAGQVEDYIKSKPLKDFAIGDKQQALYQLPDGPHYYRELIETVAAVGGLHPRDVVLSERHIKVYEPNAVPDPPAHKDRFASQIAVGFSVHVPEGSTLVFYPSDHLEINPFNSSTELRASLSQDRVPETYLRSARRVEIHDSPRDVVMFRGNSIWHLRAKPAGTTMLYLKFNAWNCDPLGEDPLTPERRDVTRRSLGLPDDELEDMVPLIGRRVDYIHRRYNRNWEEVIGIILWGKHHFTIDEQELQILQAIDGRRTLRSVIDEVGCGPGAAACLERARRLAAHGVIDMVQARHAAEPRRERQLV